MDFKGMKQDEITNEGVWMENRIVLRPRTLNIQSLEEEKAAKGARAGVVRNRGGTLGE